MRSYVTRQEESWSRFDFYSDMSLYKLPNVISVANSAFVAPSMNASVSDYKPCLLQRNVSPTNRPVDSESQPRVQLLVREIALRQRRCGRIQTDGRGLHGAISTYRAAERTGSEPSS